VGAKVEQFCDALDRLRAVARHWAGEDLCELGGERPTFLWLFGTTMIEASVDQDGACVLRAFLVLDPGDRAGLEAVIAPFAGALPVGRLEVDEEGDVALVHRVQSNASVEQLDRAIHDVCRHADRLDDILCDRLGGTRSVDRFHHDVLVALGERPQSDREVL
jgi:hypothetical protein